MSKLHNATITTGDGFAWAESPDNPNLFQVCTTENGKINPQDCGWNDGLCGDWNFGLYDDYDEAVTVFNEFVRIASTQGLLESDE